MSLVFSCDSRAFADSIIKRIGRWIWAPDSGLVKTSLEVPRRWPRCPIGQRSSAAYRIGGPFLACTTNMSIELVPWGLMQFLDLARSYVATSTALPRQRLRQPRSRRWVLLVDNPNRVSQLRLIHEYAARSIQTASPRLPSSAHFSIIQIL